MNHVEALEAGLTATQAIKLDGLRHSFEVALARCYGTKLAPIICRKLTQDLILRPDVLAFLEGAMVEEIPDSIDGWDEIAREMVGKDDLAQRNLRFSNEELRLKILSEIQTSMRPAHRLELARSGELDTYLEARVLDELEK
ncbi:hypothetical protein [Aliiroseovarius sp. PrR006]|uniref:hypothetical protein n=1 Tax=Aliiroseovarius sp. PrR006 TaxID=2706883 RepID=UPI0013D22498|nr:hypothetical protein [Aliiroseovarius sp. PrR006]NDW53659.1 hypothetical protein [Aliiroseovarius sp. PrR006]